MGYCTRYYLEKFEGPDEAAFCLEANGRTFIMKDERKWYNHEQDIARAMRKTGASLVEIRGEGEEPDDKWFKIFTMTNGEIHAAKYGTALVKHGEPRRYKIDTVEVKP